MNQFGNTRTSLSVQVTPTQIFFCQGNAIYNYTLLDKNTIRLNSVKHDCPSEELSQAIRTTRYYRFKKGILTLYDKDVILTIEMVYS